MLNENVKKLLKENMWALATCAAGVPNVVPVAFKDVTDDGKLVVGDVFLDTTLRNLAANDGRIAISVYDAKTLEGYQIRGTAEYVTEDAVVTTFKTMVEQMFQGTATSCVSRPFLHTCIRGETAVCCRQETAERSHFLCALQSLMKTETFFSTLAARRRSSFMTLTAARSRRRPSCPRTAAATARWRAF